METPPAWVSHRLCSLGNRLAQIHLSAAMAVLLLSRAKPLVPADYILQNTHIAFARPCNSDHGNRATLFRLAQRSIKTKTSRLRIFSVEHKFVTSSQSKAQRPTP